METEGEDVTRILKAMGAGDQDAAEQLLPLIYAELHRLAAAYMRRERKDHTLQPTALINEAYLRLVKERLEWHNRQHFVGVASHVMRRVLVDHARAHNAAFRGGGARRVELDEGLLYSEARSAELLSLDQALTRLAAIDPRQAKVVELRYFGGLSVEETAALLGIAPRSVKRDWSLARIWLYRQLHGSDEVPAETPKESTE